MKRGEFFNISSSVTEFDVELESELESEYSENTENQEPFGKDKMRKGPVMNLFNKGLDI